MATFSMKHILIEANSRYRYRRGLPERLHPLFGGKLEFLKVLGKTEEEALQRYSKVSARFDKKLNAPKNSSLAVEWSDQSMRHIRVSGSSSLKA
jgi:hypothetical protein